MACGDIHWAELPPPTPGQNRREQAGRRPCLIVDSSPWGSRVPTVVVVPFTTNLRTLSFPLTIFVKRSRENGLHQPSVLLLFQLLALDRSFLGERTGSVDIDTMDEVRTELRMMLGL